MVKAREHEIAVMVQMGVRDAWRQVYEEPIDHLGSGRHESREGLTASCSANHWGH